MGEIETSNYAYASCSAFKPQSALFQALFPGVFWMYNERDVCSHRLAKPRLWCIHIVFLQLLELSAGLRFCFVCLYGLCAVCLFIRFLEFLVRRCGVFGATVKAVPTAYGSSTIFLDRQHKISKMERHRNGAQLHSAKLDVVIEVFD